VKELDFYVADADKINKKYSGKHIAIVDDEVVASGIDPKEVWEKAKKKYPNKQPVLALVPKEDALVLMIG
jgi:hypoxanthine-guanine phosphoribosyltransferase